MYLTSEVKKEVFKKHGGSEKNTGSAESQIALFTLRIDHLTGHLKDNKKDLEDIPAEVKKDVKFVFVEEVEEALKIALSTWPIKVNKATKFTSMPESLMVN